jgi:hypothetical protein
MNLARMDATATLLANGKVLTTGGSPKQTAPWQAVLASAELYDPSTAKFSSTGPMRTGRIEATATLLPDGRVLVAGGWGCVHPKKCFVGNLVLGEDVLASAELYDPTTGKFTPTGSMSAPRENGTAILLASGKVLMLNGGASLAELYDPMTGDFTRDGSLLNAYANATAALLGDGKVLVVGDGPTAELFDPASGRSTSVPVVLPTPPASLTSHYTYNQIPETATTLKDGRVLVSFWSGFDDYHVSDPPYSESGLLATYDPLSGSIAQPEWISDPANWHGFRATLLADGRVLFTGGYAGPDTANVVSSPTAAALYDPIGGFRLTDANLAGARSDQTATLLSDGTVLIAGGQGDSEDQEALSSAELFRP